MNKTRQTNIVKPITTRLTKRMAITVGVILAGGIISLLPSRINAQAPGAPPIATTAEGAANVQSANEKDALHWQLALVRYEQLKTKKAVFDAELDLLSADAEVKKGPESDEFRRKLDRVKNAFEIARQQEAIWTNEVARLEARLKEIGGPAKPGSGVKDFVVQEKAAGDAPPAELAREPARAAKSGSGVKDFVVQEKAAGDAPPAELAREPARAAKSGSGVKDFVVQEKAASDAPPAELAREPARAAKSGSGANILRAVGGELLPEDSLSADYWQGLDPKSKIVFLTAYRHGEGPIENQTAKPEFYFLSKGHFGTLVTKLDEFYQIPDNRRVFLSAAIRICFMEMSGRPQTEIDQALKQAREAPYRL